MRYTLSLFVMLLVGCGYPAAPPAPPPPVPPPPAPRIEAPAEQPVLEERRHDTLKEAPADLPMMGLPSGPIIGAPPEVMVDDVLDQLAEASLAFVMPDRANVKSKVRAQLLISLRAMVDELAEELTVEGQEFTGRVLVSRVVLAKLTAPSFEVETITPERQAVSQTTSTEWLWYLTPKKTGTHAVFLTITAFVYADEANYVERHIRTFEKAIYVDVRPQQMVEAWLAKYWQWLFSTLLIPLFLYLRKRHKKS